MNRLHQSLLIGSTILASWLGMQAIHEFGHVVGAWATGGTVSQVVLSPLTISRTDLAQNPSPLMVVWMGPILGVIIPLLLWLLGRLIKMPGSYVLRFFAGFCMIANGLYIGVGTFDRVGDCGVMLRNGSPEWHLWLFGALTAPAGLWLWHQQGIHFGLGRANGQVDKRVAYGVCVISMMLLVLAFIVDGV
ncbi:MAG TPA: hypothetical protein PLN21_18885 [Gemmatales bacterium]|nr:hypothetical protein [Gemmatales bacterium]